jgi:hypothetical protein
MPFALYLLKTHKKLGDLNPRRSAGAARVQRGCSAGAARVQRESGLFRQYELPVWQIKLSFHPNGGND